MEHTINAKVITFFSQYRAQSWKKGDIVILPDQEPEGIFFLEKGIVRQYAVSRHGHEMTINMYKQFSFFPMMWALGKGTNAYYFEVISDMAVMRQASKEKVLDYLRSEPDVLFDLLARVYKGMEGLLGQVESLLSGSAYAKLVSVILIYAKRFGTPENGAVKIELKLTEKDLAAYAGIQRETVSRLLQDLFAKKLLHKDKNTFTILDLQKLEAERLK